MNNSNNCMASSSQVQMRRCEFNTIPGCYYGTSSATSSGLVDSSSEFELKTESTYEYEAQSSFQLPMNINLSVQDVIPSQFQTQKSRYSSVNNTSSNLPAKISVITSNEKTIEYGLSHSLASSKYMLNSNLSELSALIYRSGASQAYSTWTDLLASFSHAVSDTNSIIECIVNQQQGELLNEQTIYNIQSQMAQIKSQFEQTSKFYVYSLYTLDEQQTYKETYKGISTQLASLLAGSASAFAERILRFGDVDIFSASSRANVAFSLISQIVNMQYYNHFGFAENKQISLQRFIDEKQIICNTNSRILPLSDRVQGVQDRSVYYAFLRVTEILVDENALTISQEASQNDLSLSSHTSSSGNISPNATLLLEASEQHEEYLNSIQNFQAKYYGKGQLRKKRYRKTKAQVEEELKYYLALNLNQINKNN